MLERSPSPRPRAPFAALVRRVLSWPARVAEARRTLTFLAQMSDRELSDIGLLRSDLAHCAGLPLDEDPGHRLAQIRAGRAWFAPRRLGSLSTLASLAARPSRREVGDDDQGLAASDAEHGDRSWFVMNNPTNIRLTDQ
jgi:uncharacterized protein YjiS (DUF1127 family)